MNLAVIAHDGKKPEMVAFLLNNKYLLEKVNLYATGTTGGHVEKAGLAVTKLLSGPKGGDAQIAAMAAEGKIEMVIFFRDPLDKHPHEPNRTFKCSYVFVMFIIFHWQLTRLLQNFCLKAPHYRKALEALVLPYKMLMIM